jgi:hypothetical protein
MLVCELGCARKQELKFSQLGYIHGRERRMIEEGEGTGRDLAKAPLVLAKQPVRPGPICSRSADP